MTLKRHNALCQSCSILAKW